MLRSFAYGYNNLRTSVIEAFGQAVATNGSSSSPYTFAATSGYRNDGDSGLTHVGARYYDAQVGRFITRDTELDQHPYLYCDHDPVNALDPSGHSYMLSRGSGGWSYDGGGPGGGFRDWIGQKWNDIKDWFNRRGGPPGTISGKWVPSRWDNDRRWEIFPPRPIRDNDKRSMTVVAVAAIALVVLTDGAAAPVLLL